MSSLLKYDSEFNLISSYDITSISDTPSGITFDGKYFWINDGLTNIWQVYTSGDTATLIKSIKPSGFKASEVFREMVFDGKYLITLNIDEITGISIYSKIEK